METLSTGRQGLYADGAGRSGFVFAIRAGDAVEIEGSQASGMNAVVDVLEQRFPGKAAPQQAAA